MIKLESNKTRHNIRKLRQTGTEPSARYTLSTSASSISVTRHTAWSKARGYSTTEDPFRTTPACLIQVFLQSDTKNCIHYHTLRNLRFSITLFSFHSLSYFGWYPIVHSGKQIAIAGTSIEYRKAGLLLSGRHIV
jgi:hypothetical protein